MPSLLKCLHVCDVKFIRSKHPELYALAHPHGFLTLFAAHLPPTGPRRVLYEKKVAKRWLMKTPFKPTKPSQSLFNRRPAWFLWIRQTFVEQPASNFRHEKLANGPEEGVILQFYSIFRAGSGMAAHAQWIVVQFRDLLKQRIPVHHY